MRLRGAYLPLMGKWLKASELKFVVMFKKTQLRLYSQTTGVAFICPSGRNCYQILLVFSLLVNVVARMKVLNCKMLIGHD